MAKAKRAVDFDTVRKIGLALPGVEEGTTYGSPALQVRGKLLACIPVNRSAEPDSLMVRMDLADRSELLASAPEIYYVTEHYAEYDAVLVRLSRVSPEALRGLLAMAHKFVTEKLKETSRTAKRGKRR